MSCQQKLFLNERSPHVLGACAPCGVRSPSVRALEGPAALRGDLCDPSRVYTECSKIHSQRETHLLQELLDLVHRLPTEVVGLHEVFFGPLEKLADSLDAGLLQAVVGPHREFQLVDGTRESLPQFLRALGLNCVFRVASAQTEGHADSLTEHRSDLLHELELGVDIRDQIPLALHDEMHSTVTAGMRKS